MKTGKNLPMQQPGGNACAPGVFCIVGGLYGLHFFQLYFIIVNRSGVSIFMEAADDPGGDCFPAPGKNTKEV